MVYWKKDGRGQCAKDYKQRGQKKLIHKAGDALISGATSSIKKAAEKTLDKVINNSKDSGEKFKVTKELIDQLPTAGGGIVYDQKK